jgi:hypothetical protein
MAVPVGDSGITNVNTIGDRGFDVGVFDVTLG